MDSHIEPAYSPEDIEKAEKQLTEIRFDCQVNLYDKATNKRARPQWFINRVQLTLAFIATSTDEQIGRAIKDAFRDLQDHINRYQDQ